MTARDKCGLVLFCVCLAVHRLLLKTGTCQVTKEPNEARLVNGRRALRSRPASLFSISLTLSNPESVDASALRGPRLSGDRGEVRPRAVQLFVHQRQLEQLLRGPVQQPSPEEQLHPGERRQEGERPVRLVLDREVQQDVVRRRPRQLPLLLRVQHFRSSAWRHQLPPLLLSRLIVPDPFSFRPHRAR